MSKLLQPHWVGRFANTSVITSNRTLVAAWQHKPLLDQTIDDFAQATVAEQQRYDFDFAKLTPASTWQSIDQGVVDCWNNDYLGRRQIVKHAILHMDDWAALKTLDPYHGFAGNIVKAAARTRALLPAKVPLLVTVFNPFFQAVQQAGLPLVLHTAQHAPNVLNAALERLLENTLNLIEAFIASGVEGVFFVSQHASTDHISLARYQTLALPTDLVCINAIAQLPCSMVHLHGNNTHWPLFAEIDVPLHFDSATDMRMAQAANLGMCFAGGLPPDALFLQGNTHIIREAVMANRAQFASNRYIVSPGCALPLHVKAEYIHAMVAAARARH